MEQIKYKISYTGDSRISDMHHIGVSINGNYYSVIFGKYINGGFCSIPNWNVGCELSSFFDDVMWNTESIGKALKRKRDARIIAEAIRDYMGTC